MKLITSMASALLGASLLSACGSYRALPLPVDGDLIADVNAIPQLLSDVKPVDVSDGIDLDEVAIIAVLTNPDLVAARKRFGVAQAQLFATRLLPDPQFALGVDHPTSDGPGLGNAKSASVNYDLLALLTRSAGIEAQRSAANQVQLEIVWQEWQVAQRARWLFVRERSETQTLALLETTVSNFARRQLSSAKALQEGNVTIESAGPDLTALLDVGSQLYQLRQQHNQTRHELHALLGLTPDSALELKDLPAAPEPATTPVDAAAMMRPISTRRPDLLALQAGYASQEARVRQATLRFFPALGLAIARAVDTSAVYTSGLALSLDLPFFAGNRGELRVARASREQLRSEYQVRLAQTHSDISRLFSEQRILDSQRQFLQQHLPDLEAMVTEAQRAYANQDMDALAYLNIESALINKRVELLAVELALWEIEIALDTVAARVPAL